MFTYPPNLKIFSALVGKDANSGEKERYSKYTTRLNSLVDKSKYRITFGYTEKKEGYSHSNNWQMDANGGLTVKIGQSTSVSGNAYGYTMKAGSFFGKARI